MKLQQVRVKFTTVQDECVDEWKELLKCDDEDSSEMKRMHVGKWVRTCYGGGRGRGSDLVNYSSSRVPVSCIDRRV